MKYDREKRFAIAGVEKREKILDDIKNEDEKIHLIEQVEDEVEKVNLMIYIKCSDRRKVELIEKLKNKEAICMLVESLDDVELKKKYVENIEDENSKFMIINSILRKKDLNPNIIEENKEWILEQCKKMKSRDRYEYLMSDLGWDSSVTKTKKQIVEELIYRLVDEKNCEQGKYESIGIAPEITIGIEIEAEGTWGRILTTELRKGKYEVDNEIIWDWNVKDESIRPSSY